MQSCCPKERWQSCDLVLHQADYQGDAGGLLHVHEVRQLVNNTLSCTRAWQAILSRQIKQDSHGGLLLPLPLPELRVAPPGQG